MEIDRGAVTGISTMRSAARVLLLSCTFAVAQGFMNNGLLSAKNLRKAKFGNPASVSHIARGMSPAVRGKRARLPLGPNCQVVGQTTSDDRSSILTRESIIPRSAESDLQVDIVIPESERLSTPMPAETMIISDRGVTQTSKAMQRKFMIPGILEEERTVVQGLNPLELDNSKMGKLDIIYPAGLHTPQTPPEIATVRVCHALLTRLFDVTQSTCAQALLAKCFCTSPPSEQASSIRC